MIIKIHGTSGSGKTSAVRELINASILEPEEWSWYYKEKTGKVVEAVIMELCVPETPKRIYVLGSYTNKCGGVDNISDVSQVCEMIDKLHLGDAHVIFEGLITSTYYGKLGEHSKKYGDQYIYAFLDTPVDLCIERLRQRRKESGTTRVINEDLTKDKWRAINRLQVRLPNMGHKVEILDHKISMLPQLIRLMN